MSATPDHAGLADDPLAAPMQQVNQVIIDRLASDVALVEQVAAYIIHSGGKRLRPQLVLLSALANGYTGDQHYASAAVIEFIHTATLLHDDVVDASTLRRGRDTANEVWGNEAAVLVGDFLYSRAFEMLVEIGQMPIMAIMASTTNQIAEGEVMQLLNVNNADIGIEAYRAVIRAKTARLFEAGMEVGAVLAGAEAGGIEAMGRYGMHLGTAFQLVDDALDYSGDSDALGKNVGDDLAEGKPTLPLILAMQRGDAATVATVRQAIESGGRDHIEAVMAAIERTDALGGTLAMAAEEARLAGDALSALPPSIWRDQLQALADRAANRQS